MFAIKFNRFQHSAWAAVLHSGRYELMNILTFIVVKLDTSHLLLLLLKNHHNHLSHFQFSHLRAASERDENGEKKAWLMMCVWYLIQRQKEFLVGSFMTWACSDICRLCYPQFFSILARIVHLYLEAFLVPF